MPMLQKSDNINICWVFVYFVDIFLLWWNLFVVFVCIVVDDACEKAIIMIFATLTNFQITIIFVAYVVG